MPLFWKPYTSDTTQFIAGLKAKKPTLEAEQRAGRAQFALRVAATASGCERERQQQEGDATAGHPRLGASQRSISVTLMPLRRA